MFPFGAISPFYCKNATRSGENKKGERVEKFEDVDKEKKLLFLGFSEKPV